jgi:hypothetical protein
LKRSTSIRPARSEDTPDAAAEADCRAALIRISP